jgi:4-amino-4-deoxy-L-arabinose transferase-like glycosyltransferase
MPDPIHTTLRRWLHVVGQPRLFTIILLLMCGAGFALRLYQLDAKPFWFDEGLSVDLALAPPDYVIATIDRPPLYYLLLHGWIKLAGVNPYTFRFFSAWWSTLALPLFYALARRLFDRRFSLLALVLVAVSPFYVYYAQEARTYALTLALVLDSSWLLLKWLQDRRTRWLLPYSVTTLACLYTHYAALLLPLAQTAFVAASLLRRQRATPARAQIKLLITWLISQLSIAVLFLPWPIYARYGLRQLVAPDVGTLTATPLEVGAHTLWTTLREFSLGRTLSSPLADGLTLLFLFLLILGAMSLDETTLAPRQWLLWLILPPIVLLLLPRTAIYFEPKYLMVITPAFYLLMVAGLQALRHELPRWFIVCLSLVVLMMAWGLFDWFFVAVSKAA